MRRMVEWVWTERLRQSFASRQQQPLRCHHRYLTRQQCGRQQHQQQLGEAQRAGLFVPEEQHWKLKEKSAMLRAAEASPRLQTMRRGR